MNRKRDEKVSTDFNVIRLGGVIQTEGGFSGFCRGVNEILVLLGCYIAENGS